MYIDGNLTNVSGGKVSFVVDSSSSKAVAFTERKLLFKASLAFLKIQGPLLYPKVGDCVYWNNSFFFFRYWWGLWTGRCKGRCFDPVEGDNVALGMQVNAIGENADLQVIVDITSDNFLIFRVH